MKLLNSVRYIIFIIYVNCVIVLYFVDMILKVKGKIKISGKRLIILNIEWNSR